VHSWWPGDGYEVRIRSRYPALDRAFLVEDLRPALHAARVRSIILVSAAQDERETERLFSVARQHPDLVVRIVGFIDPERGDFAERLAAWCRRPLFAGLRLPLTIFDDPLWILRPKVARALDTIEQTGRIVQILAAPHHLRACTDVLTQRPALKAVLDHAGNPPVAGGSLDQWRSDMAGLASRTNAWCKVSNIRQAGDPDPPMERVETCFEHLVKHFGDDRVIVGSNWPVSGLHGEYEATFELIRALCARSGLSGEAADRILASNACRLFGLGTSGDCEQP